MRRKLKHYEMAIIRAAEVRAGPTRLKPVHSKAKPKPIYSGQKRQHVVAKVMERLKDWRFSPFEFEGSMRAGLRSGLCMKGYDWLRSDLEAASLVAEGLKLMGAKRPTWEEGQRQYAEQADNCAWCKRPLDDLRMFGSQRHCSPECARASAQANSTSESDKAVYRAAARLIDRAKAPPKPCEYCGTSFQSEREEARFCSQRCVARYQKGDRIMKDITCEVCGTVTKPRSHQSTVCSHACAGIIRRKRELAQLENMRRVCPHCGDEFTPNSRKQLICKSEHCERAAARASYYRNRVPKHVHKTCVWCGEGFVAVLDRAQFCSVEHRRAYETFHRPSKRPREITPAAFDYMFAIAA